MSHNIYLNRKKNLSPRKKRFWPLRPGWPRRGSGLTLFLTTGLILLEFSPWPGFSAPGNTPASGTQPKIEVFQAPAGGTAKQKKGTAVKAPGTKQATARKAAAAPPRKSYPVARIMLDPGHGGKAFRGRTRRGPRYGDKYDPLQRKFLKVYREGARKGKYWEREVMLSLSKKIRRILIKTRTEKGWREFQAILRKYSRDKKFKRVLFEVGMTREKNYDDIFSHTRQDVNAPFRHYDFPDAKNGRRRKGRLSKINDYQPELVLSLHLTPGNRNGGMAGIVTPGYGVFNWARSYVRYPKKRSYYKRKFQRSPWKRWMIFTGDRSRFQNFVCDAWVYFTGYWSRPNGLRADLRKHNGYRWNMLSWRYEDSKGWIGRAKKRTSALYSRSLKTFQPMNDFFRREQGQGEKWRRAGGYEGFGGDNNYATHELMRFAQYGMRMNFRQKNIKRRVGPIRDPYYSTWEVPTFINAISAYLEIGYIDSPNDMTNLTRYQEYMAESLAVGIYSLYSGMRMKWQKMPKSFRPKGKRIDFQRYRELPGNYFKRAKKPPV